jgi:hypothetical protein
MNPEQPPESNEFTPMSQGTGEEFEKALAEEPLDPEEAQDFISDHVETGSPEEQMH